MHCLWTYFVFFILILILSGQTLSAQTGKVTISLTKTTIEEVLDELRSQADINFVYNHEELAKCPPISVNAKNAKVEIVLKQCLDAAGLTFKQLNSTYIITPSEKSESMRILKAEPLKGILNGVIIDRDSRAPLPSANVVVLNTDPKRGSITDENGQFSIDNLPVGRHEVMISFVGYKEIILPEIFVGSSREAFITVAISEKTEEIDEITVTATKREESIQDVPLAITAFTGDFVRDVNLDDVKDLVTFTPGVSGNSTDAFIDGISVRGVRTQDFGVGGDPSAAFFKNNLYEGRNGAVVTSLYDLERAEIFRRGGRCGTRPFHVRGRD